jgi:DNA polymerase-1
VEDTDRPALYLLDGHALIYRAYFAMISRPLTTASGENTSAPFGLTRFLIRLIEESRPAYVGMVLDAGDSGRTAIFPEYKATREKMPDEMAASLPRCREIVEAFHVPVIELDGWEADDVIGTLADQAGDAGLRTVIVSGDKDFYQLIDDNTWLSNPGRGGPAAIAGETVRPENASDRLGVGPAYVTDYLALIGDSSDNVPGVRGIGPKTAVALIERFGHLDQILENAEQVEGKRAREALLQYGDLARLSKELVTIRRDVPVTLDLGALALGEPDRNRLRDLFLELEFHSLAREYAPTALSTSLRGGGSATATATATGGVDIPAEAEAGAKVDADADGGTSEEAYVLVEDVDTIAEVVTAMRSAALVGVDTETTSTDSMTADLVGVSVATAPGVAWYLPFEHRPPGTERDAQGNPALALDAAPVFNLPPITSGPLAEFRAALADPAVRKTGHNVKYDSIVLERAGAPLNGVQIDTSLASYVLDPGKRQHGLDILALERLEKRMVTYADVCGTGRSEIPFAEVGLDVAAAYSAEDADYTLRLAELLRIEIEDQRMLPLLEEIEMPLVPVLAEMEKRGIQVDEVFFAEMAGRIRADLRLVEEEIYKLAGGPVNLRSVPQMRQLLFDKLELPILRKTKTGPSTDESVLVELAGRGLEVPRLILEYRELDKLDSTYVSKLPAMVNPATGRIHTSFNQTVAATGRLSSSNPNLQNIPIRSDLGREIRKGFVPAEGHVFLSADYSQIELRVLAHLSGDPAFVEAFVSDRDIHRETAGRIFGVTPEAVTPGMRDRAKTINFATIYGQGPVALAAQLGISRREAEVFIEQYFERFAGVADYLERMKVQAREQGFVETLLGRRRYIPEIRSRNPGVRGFGERTATNSPIQGTAADLIKIAMIRLHDRLHGTGAHMLLQVHDELLFEVETDRLGDARAIVIAEMEGALALDVPLRVDVGTGDSWYACK